MSEFLIANLKLDRWLPEERTKAGEVPADALADLKTRGNELSVFEVDDSTNAERIVVAFSATKSDLADMGYAVFDGAPFDGLGIVSHRSPGMTPDDLVNTLHYDLQHLTATQVAGLAGAVANGRSDLILAKRLRVLLRAGLDAKRLDPARVNKKLMALLK